VTRKIAEGLEWSTCSSTTTTTTTTSARDGGGESASGDGRSGSGCRGCEEGAQDSRGRRSGCVEGQDDDTNRNDNDNGWGGVRRLQVHRRKMQEMVVDCDRALLVLVHAHISLKDTLASIRTTSGECAAVILPCCNWYSRLLHPDGRTPPRAVGQKTKPALHLRSRPSPPSPRFSSSYVLTVCLQCTRYILRHYAAEYEDLAVVSPQRLVRVFASLPCGEGSIFFSCPAEYSSKVT
jgi:hypothetical protein